MSKKKKRYPKYKELYLLKKKQEFEQKRINEEWERKQDIEKIASLAINFGKQFDISAADILNSMGMYRFGLKYDGAYESN